MSDLDEMAIRVTNVGTNLELMVFWFSQEFCSSLSPLIVAGVNIGYTNIHEAADFIWIMGCSQSDSWFIVCWASTYVQNNPTVCNLNNRWFSFANDFPSKNTMIKICGLFNISNCKKVCQDKSFFGRNLIITFLVVVISRYLTT